MPRQRQESTHSGGFNAGASGIRRRAAVVKLTFQRAQASRLLQLLRSLLSFEEVASKLVKGGRKRARSDCLIDGPLIDGTAASGASEPACLFRGNSCIDSWLLEALYLAVGRTKIVTQK